MLCQRCTVVARPLDDGRFEGLASQLRNLEVYFARYRVQRPFELASQSGFDHNGNDGRLIDYNAPEEARGEPPDDRSDVYSVGAILY